MSHAHTWQFWELIEVLKKLLLVGLMSVVLPGTLNQLTLAFIIVRAARALPPCACTL